MLKKGDKVVIDFSVVTSKNYGKRVIDIMIKFDILFNGTHEITNILEKRTQNIELNNGLMLCEDELILIE